MGKYDIISSNNHALIHSSTDETSTGESSEIGASIPEAADETANTDAAANVLLILSRS